MPRRRSSPNGHDAHHAALADDADRAIGRLDLEEHRREAGDGAGPEVRQPLRVGPDDAHARGPAPARPWRAARRSTAGVSAVSPKPDAITMAVLDAAGRAVVDAPGTTARPASRRWPGPAPPAATRRPGYVAAALRHRPVRVDRIDPSRRNRSATEYSSGRPPILFGSSEAPMIAIDCGFSAADKPLASAASPLAVVGCRPPDVVAGADVGVAGSSETGTPVAAR